MNNFKVFFFIFLFFGLFSVQTGFAENEDRVVARGKDFVMTQDFVRAIENYYAKQGHYTRWEFLVDASLRVKLFANEELSIISAQLPDDMEYGPDYASRMVKLSEDYIFRLISAHPVDDRTVLSYYRSYPEKFLENGQSPRTPFQVTRIDEPLDPDKIAPLSDELAGLIRLRIGANNRREIVNEELERLKEKYGVEIVK